MRSGDENREPFRFAEDDDSDDLGGFSRGKRSYEDEEDEENGGWAINEDHSDRLWDSAEDVDEDDEDAVIVEGEDVEEDDEEEADLFGGGAPRGRRGRPKGSTNANREKAAMSGGTARDAGFGATGGSLFDDQPAAAATPSRTASEISTVATPTTRKATSASSDGKHPMKTAAAQKPKSTARKASPKKSGSSRKKAPAKKKSSSRSAKRAGKTARRVTKAGGRRKAAAKRGGSSKGKKVRRGSRPSARRTSTRKRSRR